MILDYCLLFYIENDISSVLHIVNMAARQEISLQIRKLIIQDRQNGLSLRKIAEKYKISKTGVEWPAQSVLI